MDKQKKMKKKLFIGGAYLVIALLLLIYVSYSAYRIKIAARVQMPEALEQKASLDLQYSQRTGKATDEDGIVLNNLRPNERAEDYMLASDSEAAKARTLKFSVSNASLVDANTGLASSSEYSKLRTQYKIKLVETGTVPLKAILVDNATGEVYTATTQDQYKKRTAKFKDSNGDEAKFYFGNDHIEVHNYTLYFGWNNNKGVYDGSERKEIASVEMQAEVVESIPWVSTPSIPAPTVDWYYSLSSPSNASPSTPSNP